MNKKLFVLSVVFLGNLGEIFAQGPPCPICPPDTPQLFIDGLPLYLTLVAGVALSFVLFYKKRFTSQKKA